MSAKTDYNYSILGSLSDGETRERCWLDYGMEHKMANEILKMATTIHGTSVKQAVQTIIRFFPF